MEDRLTACKDCVWHRQNEISHGWQATHTEMIEGQWRCFVDWCRSPHQPVESYFDSYKGEFEETSGHSLCNQINTDGHCKHFKEKV